MQRPKILEKTLLRLTCFVFIYAAVLHGTTFGETIKLKSKAVVTAKILEHASDHIKVDLSGVTVTYYKDEIVSIKPDPPETFANPPDKTETPEKDFHKLIEDVASSVVVVLAKKEKSTTEATGFFVSTDGLIVTNLHVVFNASSITIRTKEGKTYPVEFIANYDNQLDICLLKINIENVQPLVLGNSQNLIPGQILFTIGHREGSLYQTSSGPFIGEVTLDEDKNLQSKIVTGHGNSGGPLFNEKGEVVGISKAFGPETGNNFSIPVNQAKKFLVYNSPQTLEDFNRQISPAHVLTYAAEGALLERKFQDALATFRQALAIDPKHIKALIGTAKTYSALNQKNDALKAWQEVHKVDPDNLLALTRIGEIYLDRNEINESIGYLQKAATLKTQSSKTYSDLGFAYGQLGKLNEALASYKMATELAPQNAECHYNLAVAYFNKQNFTKAKEYSQKAVELGYTIPDSFLKQINEAQKFGSTFEIK